MTRGRGRPVVLSSEERLKRERERWRRKKARQRKEAYDAEWERKTNFCYFVNLWVPHYNRLTETLVAIGYLCPEDANLAPRIDAAVDDCLADGGLETYGGTYSRKLGPDTPGTVRVKMTQDLAVKIAEFESHRREEPIDVDQFIQDRRALVKVAEGFLFRFYSTHVPNPKRYPCNCKLALDACECILRFKPTPGPGVLTVAPKKKRPTAGKPLVKQSLYSAPMPRWWRNPSYDQDPLIRSHARLTYEAPTSDDEADD